VLRPESFPSILNIANLITQAGAICVLAMGLVPVLLLGDIDLSAGVAGGSCAAVMANLMLPDYNLHWAIAVLVALATGAAIGLTIGLLVALLGVPSFVVTLAFFLALQGITLRVVGQGGSLPVREGASGPIYDIANNNMPVIAGWVSVVAILVLYAAVTLMSYRTLVRGQPSAPADVAGRVEARGPVRGAARRYLPPEYRPRGVTGRGSRAAAQRGLPVGRPTGRCAVHRVDIRVLQDHLRPARLRRRRQPRGSPPCRHRRHADPYLGVRDLHHDGRDQRHHRGVAAETGSTPAPVAATCCSTRSAPR
jgi:hypothetical protein